ncbi:MAG: SDR family NAD(P)-dependent oxidoreductase [Microthrixaceae bacterium]|nr:SDR family NAD(P)-dependent oxidoreductase [Microthrixaceae bacterium]
MHAAHNLSRVSTAWWRTARYARAIGPRVRKYSRYSLAERHALVTGGSSGIGAELCKELVSRGASVTSVDVTPPTCDVAGITHLDGDVRTFDFGSLAPIDLIVANAGVVDSTRHRPLTEDAVRRLIDINLVGVARTLTAPTTPSGRALIISSRSAVAPEAPGALYGATKAAALNYGLSAGSVRPTTVALVGITATNLFAAEADYQGRAVDPPRSTFGDPSEVARACLDAVEAGDPLVITDRDTLRDVSAFGFAFLTARLR